jgi:mono/diheme cytochrome c family protein
MPKAIMSRTLLLIYCYAVSVLAPTASSAADSENGKLLANRWCSSCHIVGPEQKLATDQAPPFAIIARTPNFDASTLAYLLLRPHPNMPKLELSRAEIADLAAFVATLK